MIEIHFQLTQKGIYWLMKVASTLPAFRTEGVNLYCDHPGCGVCYASPSRLTRTRALSRHLALRVTLPLGSKAATGPPPRLELVGCGGTADKWAEWAVPTSVLGGRL